MQTSQHTEQLCTHSAAAQTHVGGVGTLIQLLAKKSSNVVYQQTLWVTAKDWHYQSSTLHTWSIHGDLFARRSNKCSGWSRSNKAQFISITDSAVMKTSNTTWAGWLKLFNGANSKCAKLWEVAGNKKNNNGERERELATMSKTKGGKGGWWNARKKNN